MPSYCPRSSLPAKVLAWLAARLAHLNPPRRSGQGGTRPLALEVRLDAVAAVILDGLSYRRAGRMVGISKTEVGDSLDLLLGPLGALGFCQPDGTFITGLDDLRRWLAEMTRSGEAVCLDGLAIRVQRPRGGPTRRCCTTPSGTPTPPRAWPSRASTATCCGWTAAGRATAMSTNWWHCRGWMGRWTASRWLACWIGGSGAGQATRALACAGRGPPHHRPPHRRPAGPQPAAGRAARWWSRRSPTLQAPGRCVAGGGCCIGCGMSTGPLVRSFAWADGCTGYPHDQASRTPRSHA
jgi:hypothetical protein